MKTSIGDVLRNIKTVWIPYLFVLAVCLVISVVYTKADIYFTVNSLHFSWGDQFFAPYTNMGDGLVCVAITLFLLLFSYRKALLMGSSYALTSIIAQVLKHIVATPRPLSYFSSQMSRIYLVKGVEVYQSFSFPSGHSVSAFSAAVVLTYLTPRKAWGLLFFVMACLVGYSRMYLSEHFFEDVVGGSELGVFVTILWVAWLDNHRFIRSPKWNRGLLFNKQTA